MAISITKPTVGGSEDSWGTTINTALDAIVLEINSNADGTNAITPNLTEGSWEISTTPVTASAAELNILDGVTATATELNTLDGDTAAISTTVVDADRVVFNDDGTMKQVAMSDLKTYINASVGSGSVTSVGLAAPTGLTVSGSPVTTSGTLALTFTSGYSIPTTSSQSNWDTAFGWGDHSTQGYLTSAPAPTTAQVGTATAGLSYDDLGTYVFGAIYSSAIVGQGSNYAGSSIKPAGLHDVNTSLTDDSSVDINGTKGGSTLTGTWKAMGRSASISGSTKGRYTLFLKVVS